MNNTDFGVTGLTTKSTGLGKWNMNATEIFNWAVTGTLFVGVGVAALVLFIRGVVMANNSNSSSSSHSSGSSSSDSSSSSESSGSTSLAVDTEALEITTLNRARRLRKLNQKRASLNNQQPKQPVVEESQIPVFEPLGFDSEMDMAEF